MTRFLRSLNGPIVVETLHTCTNVCIIRSACRTSSIPLSLAFSRLAFLPAPGEIHVSPTLLRVFSRSFAVAGLVLALSSACGPGEGGSGGHAGFGGPVPVSVVAVTPEALPVILEYAAQTLGSREVEVRARVTGILEKRNYSEGGRVKAGPVAVHHRPRPLCRRRSPGRGRCGRGGGPGRPVSPRRSAPGATPGVQGHQPEGIRRRHFRRRHRRRRPQGRPRPPDRGPPQPGLDPGGIAHRRYRQPGPQIRRLPGFRARRAADHGFPDRPHAGALRGRRQRAPQVTPGGRRRPPALARGGPLHGGGQAGRLSTAATTAGRASPTSATCAFPAIRAPAKCGRRSPTRMVC